MDEKKLTDLTRAVVTLTEAIDGLKESMVDVSKDVSEINKAQARILMFIESLHMWQTSAIAKGG